MSRVWSVSRLLRLLLDEHISPVIASQLVARNTELTVVAMRSWDQGAHLGEDDETILAAARDQDPTLVTYDQRTIPPLLRTWAEQSLAS